MLRVVLRGIAFGLASGCAALHGRTRIARFMMICMFVIHRVVLMRWLLLVLIMLVLLWMIFHHFLFSFVQAAVCQCVSTWIFLSLSTIHDVPQKNKVTVGEKKFQESGFSA
jgi:hypothetical protein